MKAASGIISEEQFFKESYCYVFVILSYFPNGEYSQGVSILQDVDGQIQKLRDEAVGVGKYLHRRQKPFII